MVNREISEIKNTNIILAVMVTVLIPYISRFVVSFTVIVTNIIYKSFSLEKKYVNVQDNIQIIMEKPITLVAMAIVSIYIMYLWALKVENRNLFANNLSLKHNMKAYLLGFLTGGSIISLTFWLTFLCDDVGVKLGTLQFSILFYVAIWCFQGLSEEVLFRGFLLNNICKRYNAVIGIIISSILFSLIHITNPGYSIVAFINLSLFGILASLMTLWTKSIWAASAFHATWNLFQSNVFGLPVSGYTKLQRSVLYTTYNQDNYINGGQFGPENGIIILIVLTFIILLAIALKLFFNRVHCKSDLYM